MSKDFNISMICLILNWFVYDPSWMLHLSDFVRTLRSSVLVVFDNFLLIYATARSKIISDQKRFFIALSLYPLSFFANTPFKAMDPHFSIERIREANCVLIFCLSEWKLLIVHSESKESFAVFLDISLKLLVSIFKTILHSLCIYLYVV